MTICQDGKETEKVKVSAEPILVPSPRLPATPVALARLRQVREHAQDVVLCSDAS